MKRNCIDIRCEAKEVITDFLLSAITSLNIIFKAAVIATITRIIIFVLVEI